MLNRVPWPPVPLASRFFVSSPPVLLRAPPPLADTACSGVQLGIVPPHFARASKRGGQTGVSVCLCVSERERGREKDMLRRLYSITRAVLQVCAWNRGRGGGDGGYLAGSSGKAYATEGMGSFHGYPLTPPAPPPSLSLSLSRTSPVHSRERERE